MESTPPASDARARLDELAAELAARGWKGEFVVIRKMPALLVRNPKIPNLNEKVVFASGTYRWPWGADIWPTADVAVVADRITYVLREVSGDLLWT